MQTTIQVIMLISVMVMGGNSLDSEVYTDPPLDVSIQHLSKKWQLDHYSIGLYSESPAPKEKNDYLQLNTDLTFDSMEEGVREKGNWRLDVGTKRIFLNKASEKGALSLKVHHLSRHKLILSIDDPDDRKTRFLHIHFTTN